MVFSDLLLARRIETAEAANARGCTAIHAEAAALDVAGGCAVFVGAGSPLSHAMGIPGNIADPAFDAAIRDAPSLSPMLPLVSNVNTIDDGGWSTFNRYVAPGVTSAV